MVSIHKTNTGYIIQVGNGLTIPAASIRGAVAICRAHKLGPIMEVRV